MAMLSPPGMACVVTDTEAELASSTCDTLCTEKIGVLDATVVDSPRADNGRDLGPGTPVPEKGSGEAFVGSNTPLTCVSKPMVEVCDETEAQAQISDDVHTPKTHVFNPFAPGPDELMFAPRKKGLEECRSIPARRLKFDSDSDSSGDVVEDDCKDVNHDKYFLDLRYESFLDVIVTKETERTVAENFPLGLNFSNGFNTPTSSPLLTGIADTCPGAPMKPVGVARNLKLGICRKLEF